MIYKTVLNKLFEMRAYKFACCDWCECYFIPNKSDKFEKLILKSRSVGYTTMIIQSQKCVYESAGDHYVCTTCKTIKDILE